MINCRVFYNIDGSVLVMHPAPKARLIGETDADFVARICAKDGKNNGLDSLPFDDIDKINLPPHIDRDKWRGNKQQGVYVDTSIVTKTEQRAAIQVKIDSELDKAVPNSGLILKWQRDLKNIN